MDLGLARCSEPDCLTLRTEFEQYESVVSPVLGHCCISGARTDVRLSNGKWLWAPYFIDFIRTGWLPEEIANSDRFFKAYPDWSH